MKLRIMMASGTIESNGVVRATQPIDYEEHDGWVASKRDRDGWMNWHRSDGWRVFRVGALCHALIWDVATPDGRLLQGKSRARRFKTAEAARAAVDREHPLARKELPCS